MLRHLLSSNYLSEILIQLLLENYLRLSSADNDLANNFRVVISVLYSLTNQDLLCLSTLALLTLAMSDILQIPEEHQLFIV